MRTYTGMFNDGLDIKIIQGVYKSPCGLYWSSEPITKEQKAASIIDEHCGKYHKSYNDLYDQLKSGSKENLPKWVRNHFIKHMENVRN